MVLQQNVDLFLYKLTKIKIIQRTNKVIYLSDESAFSTLSGTDPGDPLGQFPLFLRRTANVMALVLV